MIGPEECMIVDTIRVPGSTTAVAAIRGGPRETVVFAPGEAVAAIVTCGGLCPGLNDCVHELTNVLYYNYGVDTIYGIRSGYR